MNFGRLRSTHLLLVSAAAGGFAVAVGASPRASSATDSALSAANAPSATPEEESPAEATDDETTPLSGEVLEVLDVPGYTYARIGDKGTDGTWVAVPSAKLAPGQHLEVHDATEMTDFASGTLKRTFATIWFGVLAEDEATGASAQDAYAPAAGLRADPANRHARGDPHAAAATSSVEVKKVDRAPGTNGRTVAEIVAAREALSGKTLRVRATVVKSTPGVLGKTWLHLRDGSGDAAAGTNDLTATTDETPAVGDTVLLEGTLALDRDIGSGYRFATLLDDAKRISP